MSYANLMMYSAVLPSYDSDKDDATNAKKVNGDDPESMNDILSYLY